MPLKLRPTGLGSGIDEDRPDYAVYSGKWEVGRIYQTRGVPTVCVGFGRSQHMPSPRSTDSSTRTPCSLSATLLAPKRDQIAHFPL